tara:strand:+ start:804 stop:1523 length:720 start_codon:yes stop_codon:yes gene_type:complete
MKLHQKLINLFIPLILRPSVIINLINKLINKKPKKNFLSFEENFYTRQAFINKAISKFKNCKYLEIGVSENKVFNGIPLKLADKFGVDPENGGNYRMTSDVFFTQNYDLKFNVVFIDGLHTYEQCQKDCINSMNSLVEGGVVLFHDMLPRNELEQIVPQNTALSWTGDVWKVAVELSNSENVDFRIINIDRGIGILKLKKNFNYKKMPELKNAKYDFFMNYYKKFKIIKSEEALDFIEE